MITVKLTRRWGSHPAGETVDVSETVGAWLVGHDFAAGTDDIPARLTHPAARVYPATDGAGPLAGGDPTRLRPRTRSSRSGE